MLQKTAFSQKLSTFSRRNPLRLPLRPERFPSILPLGLVMLASKLGQEFAWVRNSPCDRAGRNRRRRGQKYLAFLVTHSTWEISVRCANALQGHVHSPKGIHR